MQLLLGLGIPLLGTVLGAAMVFFMRNKMNIKVEKILLGFASGVMIAASIWSLIMPSIDMAKEQGKIAWIPASIGFLFGIVFFKIGGYIYKFLMVYLLNNYAYGILTIISPFQNILQTLAAGGLPPTISKYVSEYNATNQKENSYKLILVSIKIAILLGITFGLLMIFFIAPLLVKIYNNNSLLLPLQIIGLIVPFSAIVGVFRGIFQGM